MPIFSCMLIVDITTTPKFARGWCGKKHSFVIEFIKQLATSKNGLFILIIFIAKLLVLFFSKFVCLVLVIKNKLEDFCIFVQRLKKIKKH